MAQRLALCGLGVLCVLCGNVVHAQTPPTPAQLDKAKAIVARVDQDRDGRVSLPEYAIAKLRELNGGQAGHHKLTPKSDPGLRALDANKDGTLSPEEYAKGYIAEEFRYIDANKDKLLDAAEIAAAMDQGERAQRGEKKSGFVERYDLDGDGKVTRAEFPGSDAVFARLDTNRDGVISAADVP